MKKTRRLFLAFGLSLLVLGGCDPIRRLLPNSAPVADAGPDQVATVGSTVYLEGSGSDADGDDLEYSWFFFGAPTGSGAVLYDWDRATAYFSPDLGGDDYVFLLTVSDGTSESVPDKVTITVP
jgi:hypothetical protein